MLSIELRASICFGSKQTTFNLKYFYLSGISLKLVHSIKFISVRKRKKNNNNKDNNNNNLFRKQASYVF